jgi:hypothetical protein
MQPKPNPRAPLSASLKSAGAEPPITRSDRDALLRYDRSRVKARKDDAEAYGAYLLAQFEEQVAREYSFNEDSTWSAAVAAAEAAVNQARHQIAERCAALGIPRWAQPELGGAYWYDRGANACKKRRAELRKVAESKAEALVKQAKAQIERDSLNFQSQLLTGSLTTAAGKALLDALPPVASLMPPLNLTDFKLLDKGGEPDEEL